MDAKQRLLLATVCGVSVAGIYAAQPVLGQMGRDLGLPERSAGLIVAVGQFGYLAGLILLVPLGDLLDRRRLIAAHLVVTAVGMVVTACALTSWVAFAGLALVGLFAVVVQTTVAYAAAICEPEEQGRTIGVVTSGVVIGILGARVVTGAIAQAWSWRAIYLVLAAAAVLLAVLLLTVSPPDPRPSGERTYRRALTDFGALFRQPAFLGRGLIAFFLFASFGTLWSGLSLPLAAAPWHLNETTVGLFGLFGVAGALGAARAGRWADSGHGVRAAGIALVLLIASWAASAQLPSMLWLPIIGIVALDFAVQVVHVGNQHVLTTVFADRVSSVLGAYMVFYSLGSALGAAATTAVYSAHGWVGSSLLGGGFAACALLVWAVTVRWASTRRDGPATESAVAGPDIEPATAGS